MSDARAAYDELQARSPQRTVFAEPWWLDAAVGADGWRPNLLRRDGEPARAAWPLVERDTRFGPVGTGAAYTPLLGPLLGDGLRRSAQIDLLEELGGLLAQYAHVEAACAPELDYWTPLHWLGFTQTARSSWRIADPSDLDAARAAMRKGARGELKAADRAKLVVDVATVQELLQASDATFARQGARTPDRAVLERVARAAIERGRGDLLAVRTSSGELAAAGLFPHDDRVTWNLANGRLDQVDAPGAATLLLWSAIERAAARGTAFDFEGSMLRPVERFVRGFGGEPHAYSVVRRSTPAWERRGRVARAVRRLRPGR